MATYRINIENTGLNSDDQVEAMAAAMRADGHDVEATRLFGMINRDDVENPVGEQAWMAYVIAADGC